VVELSSFMIENFIRPQLSQIEEMKDLKKRMDSLLEVFLFLTGHRDDTRVFPSTFYLASRNQEIQEKMMGRLQVIQDFIVNEPKKYA